MTNYIYYAAIALEFVLSLILFCSNRSITSKGKRLANECLKDSLLSNLKVGLSTFIAEAEDLFGAGNGRAKLNYVLNKVHIKCLELSLPYDEAEIKRCVEDILATPQKKEVADETSRSD